MAKPMPPNRSLFQRLSKGLDRLTTPAALTPEDGLRYWQSRILLAILLASLTLGLFVYIPSVLLSIAESLWVVAAIDTLMYVLLLFIYCNANLPYMLRAGVVAGLSYMLGLVLLFILGPFGAGPIWIFTFPLLAGVLMGFYPSVIALSINAATLAAIGIFLHSGLAQWNVVLGHSVIKWTVISLNFMLLNVVAALSVTAILKSLDRALSDEKAAIGALARQQEEILQANEQLKKEIKEHARAEQANQKLEAQLRQAQKMEAVGTLAGGIAHDFNNILYTIMGFTELTLDDLDPESASHSNLQQVLASSRRARDLVRQILTFSRQSETRSQPVMVRPIAKEVLKMMRATLPAGIAIQSEIQSDASITGDPTQIHQILMNLCTNAAQAMQPEGGTLTVRLLDTQLDQSFADYHPDITPGPHIQITVADTGPGIGPELLEKIFDPFFTTKKPGEGTGMGLSVVHGIVKRLGGGLRVYSEPGRGTEFKVFLPARQSSDTAPVEDTEETLPEGDARILLIDDEAAIVQMGRQMLTSLGYEVTTETDGLEALETFKANPEAFDLVITDMTMPAINGDRLAAGILKIRPGLPVILCTGYSSMVSEESARSMGIAALCMKPLVRKDLAAVIKRVLQSPSDPEQTEACS